MNIAFRLDVSKQIGSGHFARCLTLANALQKLGHSTTFFSRALPNSFKQRLDKIGHEYSDLKQFTIASDRIKIKGTRELAHSHWLEVSQEKDSAIVKKALQGKAWDWMVVDHYALDAYWETEILSEVCQVMVIDDLADREHNCSILLDQNLVKNKEERYANLVSPDCKKLLGPGYALLLPEYAELHRKVKPRHLLKEILVYFGGADPQGLTEKTIDALLKCKLEAVTTHIVLPALDEPSQSLLEKIEGRNDFVTYNYLPSLASLMAKVDLAIGATGATSWERLCLGVPSIAVVMAKNQEEVSLELSKAGLIRLLGNQHDITSDLIRNEVMSILKTDFIGISSKKCFSFCDAKGVQRVCEALCHLKRKNI